MQVSPLIDSQTQVFRLKSPSHQCPLARTFHTQASYYVVITLAVLQEPLHSSRRITYTCHNINIEIEESFCNHLIDLLDPHRHVSLSRCGHFIPRVQVGPCCRRRRQGGGPSRSASPVQLIVRRFFLERFLEAKCPCQQAAARRRPSQYHSASRHCKRRSEPCSLSSPTSPSCSYSSRRGKTEG